MSVSPVPSVYLPAIAPFSLAYTARLLQRRPGNAVDHWDGLVYRRVIAICGRAVPIAIRSAGHKRGIGVLLEGRFRASESEQVAATVERLLGLRINLQPFYAAFDDRFPLRGLAESLRGMKPPRFPSVFEALVNAICCQQVSLTVGLRVMNRVAESAGGYRVADSCRLIVFPGPDRLAAADPVALRQLGLSNAKARALIEVAGAFASGAVSDAELEALPNYAAAERLEKLPGIGPWSARYALLRGLGRLDVFPSGDTGAASTLAALLNKRRMTPAAAEAFASAWAGYRGFLYFHMLGSSFGVAASAESPVRPRSRAARNNEDESRN